MLPADAEAMASKAASSMAPELTKIVHGYEDAESAQPADVQAAPSQSTQQGGSSAKPAPSAEAPLFELRALGNKQISEWVATADTAFAQIEDALGGARYQGPGWQPKTPSAQAQGGAAQHQPDSGEFQETEDPTRRYQPQADAEPRVVNLSGRRQPQTAARRRSCCVIM